MLGFRRKDGAEVGEIERNTQEMERTRVMDMVRSIPVNIDIEIIEIAKMMKILADIIRSI